MLVMDFCAKEKKNNLTSHPEQNNLWFYFGKTVQQRLKNNNKGIHFSSSINKAVFRKMKIQRKKDHAQTFLKSHFTYAPKFSPDGANFSPAQSALQNTDTSQVPF